MSVLPIIVAGSLAVDRIMTYGGSYEDVIHPDKLGSLSVSMLLESSHDAPGGVGGNVAYALALLSERPILLGSVGRDAGGYIQKLASIGVATNYIHWSDLPTASFTVMTDSKQGQIAGFYAGAMSDSKSLTLDRWKDENPLVLVSAHDPAAMRRQVEECEKYGLQLCYDVGQQANNLDAEDIMAGVDVATVLFANDYEIATISKKIGRSIDDIKASVPIVVTTYGADGSVCEGKNVTEPIKVGVATPRTVIDSTGAGDAYRAGFLYGYARSMPLKKCCQLGATCAAYAVETMGTQEYTMTYEQIAERYKENFGEEL